MDYFARKPPKAQMQTEKMEMKESDFEIDEGLFVASKTTNPDCGLVVHKNYLQDQIAPEDALFSDQLRPSSVAINKTPIRLNLNQHGEVIKTDNSPFCHEEVNLLMGTTDGGIYIFDPVIRGRMEIKRFKHDFEKRKTVDLVKWLPVSNAKKV